jgi:hypothetical protein
MRPVPIPDQYVAPFARRMVIAAPDGDLTNQQIAPVEALVELHDGSPRFAMLIQLEHDDLTRWYANRDQQWPPRFWLYFWSDHLHPFAVESRGV